LFQLSTTQSPSKGVAELEVVASTSTLVPTGIIDSTCLLPALEILTGIDPEASKYISSPSSVLGSVSKTAGLSLKTVEFSSTKFCCIEITVLVFESAKPSIPESIVFVLPTS